MVRVCCISDTHGYLPQIPECDVLVHAGDITRVNCSHGFQQQLGFLSTTCLAWFKSVPAKHKVLVPGNHDLIFEALLHSYAPTHDVVCGLKSKYEQYNIHILIDDGVILENLLFYGSPWQRFFHNWAFNSNEEAPEKRLQEKFGLIPNSTDVLVTHSPPFGIGDWLSRATSFEHLGSHALLSVTRTVKPPLHVFGHIHEACGQYVDDDRMLCNAAYVGEDYKPIGHLPFIYDINPDTREVTIPCQGG